MEKREMAYAEKLATLIRKETVSSYDDVDLTKFYEFVEILRKEFPRVFEVCEVEDFKGSLLLKWKGRDADRQPVMFMNHYDVVSGEGDWKYLAFSGKIAEGKVWGRGTLDTKGGLCCMLIAAEELMERGFVPQGDVYFESACTEEASGEGADIISKELQRRGIRFAYTLDEGGMILHDPIGGADGDFAMIGIGEKNSLTIEVSAKSNGGHASMPGKNTPLVRLAKFMVAVERSHAFKRHIDPAIYEFFQRASTKMHGALKFVLGHAKAFAPLLKLVLPSISPAAGAMMATTVAFTMARGAESFNSLPQEAVITVNMRASHHQGSDDSVKALKKIAERYDLTVSVPDPGLDSRICPFKSKPFEAVERAVMEVYPGVVSSPYIMTGASDSRFIDRVSDICLRFAPFFITDEQLAGIHGVNENVDVDNLPKAVDFYKKLMENC